MTVLGGGTCECEDNAQTLGRNLSIWRWYLGSGKQLKGLGVRACGKIYGGRSVFSGGRTEDVQAEEGCIPHFSPPPPQAPHPILLLPVWSPPPSRCIPWKFVPSWLQSDGRRTARPTGYKIPGSEPEFALLRGRGQLSPSSCCCCYHQ